MSTPILSEINPADFYRTLAAVVVMLLAAAVLLYIVAYVLVNWLLTSHGRQRLRASLHGFALEVRDGAGMVLFFGIFTGIAFAVILAFAPELVSRNKMLAIALAGCAAYLACCGLAEFWRTMGGLAARGGGVTQTIERGRHVGTQAEAQRAVDRQARLQGQRGNLGRQSLLSRLAGWLLRRRS